MVAPEAIERAAQRLLAEAGPGCRVYLFGSHARGEAGPHSDVDFLVVEPKVEGRHAEMVRLRRALRDFPAPIDVIVYSDDQVERFARTWGHVVRHALEEGRLVASS